MKILVHDYAGHPFQLDLSHELAKRGHQVLHLHFGGLQTPKAGFERPHPPGLTVRAVNISRPFDKGKLIGRYLRELEYGRAVSAEIGAFRPETVLSANTPPNIQAAIMGASRRVPARFYFWMQDFYSLALRRLLPEKLPVLGNAIARYYEHIERGQVKNSDGAIFITADFLQVASDWGIRPQRCHVIENWAPLTELSPRCQSNPWSRRNGLDGKRVLLYSGTLGMKHNPELLWQLALLTRDLPDVVVAVVSSGPGGQFLRERQQAVPLATLRLFETQPFVDLPDMLGTAEVLLAILEPDAGVFSVPSKVLTYLCAERPLLCAIPKQNLAAQIVIRSGAGMVVDPTDPQGFHCAARDLLNDPDGCARMAHAARDYALAAFDGAAIAAQFERVLSGAPAIWHTHEQRTVALTPYAVPAE